MDQSPQITPGQNGYLAPVALSPWTNPWTGTANQDQATAATAVPAGLQGLATQGSQMQAYQDQSAPYPSFPNSFGLGSQNAFSQSQTQPPAPQQSASPSGPTPTLSPSGSFNPWSMLGESNAR